MRELPVKSTVVKMIAVSNHVWHVLFAERGASFWSVVNPSVYAHPRQSRSPRRKRRWHISRGRLPFRRRTNHRHYDSFSARAVVVWNTENNGWLREPWQQTVDWLINYPVCPSVSANLPTLVVEFRRGQKRASRKVALLFVYISCSSQSTSPWGLCQQRINRFFRFLSRS